MAIPPSTKLLGTLATDVMASVAKTLVQAGFYLLGGSVILLGGAQLYYEHIRPKTVYVIDLNNDGLQDVVARSPGETLIFLGQRDGAYRRLDDVLDEQRNISRIQTRTLIEDLRKSIEAKVQDLK